MKQKALSKSDYAELVSTAKKIVKYEKGEKVKGYMRYTRLTPVTTKDVKEVRQLVHQTQAGFAGMLGVSIQLIQAREQGWRTLEPPPSKAIRAIRPIRILEKF